MGGGVDRREGRRAVSGLGELIDGYEFHYPNELSPDNLDDVREALGDHDVYCLCSGLHLEPRFGKGGLSSPDDAVRDEALRLTLEAVDFAGELGAQFVIWPGIEGYNYPFQTPYAECWARFVDGIGAAAERAAERGVTIFLEHKNSEPAMKILMRNVGMTLHVIHTLRTRGLDNVKVNMDWQHLIMNGENLAEYAALLAADGLLGHQHANSGWGTFDDDNMVGATAFMETVELAIELRRAGYGDRGERLGFDLYPYTEDAIEAVRRSVLQWRFIDSVAAKIDGPRCARRRPRRTRCARTSWSTPLWAREAAARLHPDPTRRGRAGARLLRRAARPRGAGGTAEARPVAVRLVPRRRRPGAAPDARRRAAGGQAALLPRRRRPGGLRGRLEEAGVETRDATELVGRPRFTCRDPFGNLVELARIDEP